MFSTEDITNKNIIGAQIDFKKLNQQSIICLKKFGFKTVNNAGQKNLVIICKKAAINVAKIK